MSGRRGRLERLYEVVFLIKLNKGEEEKTAEMALDVCCSVCVLYLFKMMEIILLASWQTINTD